jgi:hypothetical protein
VQQTELNTESKLHELGSSSNHFEAQYDPNNDFAIFGVGNDRLGGIQNMQEKMNMADKAQSESSEEEEYSKGSQVTESKKVSTTEPSSGC